MYTTIQALHFVPKVAAGSPPEATNPLITDVFAATGGKSQILTLYSDPSRPNDTKDTNGLNVYSIRTLEDWGKLVLARFVLQGL